MWAVHWLVRRVGVCRAWVAQKFRQECSCRAVKMDVASTRRLESCVVGRVYKVNRAKSMRNQFAVRHCAECRSLRIGDRFWSSWSEIFVSCRPRYDHPSSVIHSVHCVASSRRIITGATAPFVSRLERSAQVPIKSCKRNPAQQYQVLSRCQEDWRYVSRWLC